ncbi:hypothetical protein [Desulfonema magnum]|nr:hypothetical protein [Desulfonema magnum]
MKRLKIIISAFMMMSGIAVCLPFYTAAEQIGFDMNRNVPDTSFLKSEHIKSDDAFSDTGTQPYPEDYSYGNDIWMGDICDSFFPGDTMFHFSWPKVCDGDFYLWNYNDILNPTKAHEPAFRLDGFESAYMSYSFGGEHEITTAYSGISNEESGNLKHKDSKYQVRMKTHINILDMAIHYSEIKQKRTDYERLMTGAVSDEDATIPVRWRFLSAGLKSKIAGVGIHAEGGHAWLTLDDETEPSVNETLAKDHSKFLVGVDYTFENELYLILEYYQEGEGKTSPDKYTLNDRLGYLSDERDTIGRDNVLVGAKYPIADVTSIELYNIINANDSSVIMNPWFVWNPEDDIRVKFSAQIPIGKEESAVGQAHPSAFAHIELNF